MRDRRDIPEPEHTNTYAGAVYTESLFDDLVMNMNDQMYQSEGDRFDSLFYTGLSLALVTGKKAYHKFSARLARNEIILN